MAQRGALAVKPEGALLRHRIHLHHHAVDFVRQFVAPRLPLGAEGQHLFHVLAKLAVAG